jgi:amino acid adenylation domain-containing protein
MDATLPHSDTFRSRLEWMSLVELLRSRGRSHADRKLYTFLPDGPSAESSVTFAELDQRACAIGAWLQSAGAEQQRVLLLFPPGLDYIAAFFGCLYAKAVAVPAYPPRQNRNLERLAAVVHDARPIIVLTTQAILSQVERMPETAELQMLKWIAIESINESWANIWKQPDADAETLAFLQYTSGSTARPKGVMVTHGNLLHNEELIQRAFMQTEQSIIVGWLPLFHDMGLIGNVLQPLYLGARCVLLSPMSFLQRPFRWLETISRYRATTSGGPNFAYDFCVRKISPAQREALDLSSWTLAFNGSEPVRPETLDRFCEAFEPCGFQRRAFFSCYGLAEATLFVSGGPAQTDPKVKAFKRSGLEQNNVVPASLDDRDVRRLVSCGEGTTEQQIRIVDPETFVECRSGRVGEIWVSGPSIAQGYWNNPDESKRIFQATLADTREEHYLRTGDLGLIDDDQLFITGRLKDLIIIRGRNCYPEDIEHSVGVCDPALRRGEGAAFSVDIDGEERLVVVHEVTKEHRDSDLTETIENIRKVIAEEHDLQLYAVALIKPGEISKTSSGKIRRQAMKSAFAKGKLDVILSWELSESSTEAQSERVTVTHEAIKEWIAAKLASLLGLTCSQIDVDVSIAHYGLDSLAALDLAHSLELNLDASLPVITFMQDVTISELAALVLEQLEQHPDSMEASRPATQHQTLSYGQAALWFLHKLAPQNTSYNVVSAARIRGSLNTVTLKNAFQLLTERHTELRVRFEVRNGEPVKTIQENASVSFREEDATGWSDERIKQRLSEEACRPFDLENGPLFRVTLLCVSESEYVLLIAAHHIVIDMWSLAVLVRELGTFYSAQKVEPLEISYQDYVQWQQQMLAGPRGARLLEYWQQQLAGELPVLNLNTDRPRPSAQIYDGSSVSIKLNPETVRGLQVLASDNLTTLYTVLLAAYLTLLNRHTGQEELIVGTPTSGRTDARFQQLVGYFVNTIPIRATLNAELTFRQFLTQVRAVVLAGFEHQEYPFALLVNEVCPDRDPSRSPVFQTTFVFDKPPAFSDPSLAAFVVGEEGAQLELGSLTLESVEFDQEIAQFDLSMVVVPIGDELKFALQFNRNLFNSDTVARMLEHFEILVNEITAHPEKRLLELGLLSAAEERQLRKFNETKADYGREEYLHQLFEAQVERTPQAIALISEGQELSYEEVNRRANRLAHHLRGLGVGPETRVGLLLERSPELIISLLAVLKAGGAYLPLDAAYPRERLRFILEDTKAAVVLTQQSLVPSLPEQDGLLVNLDAAAETIARQSAENPRPWGQAGNLSHIIYTSGSTGRPKGVAIAHGSVVNFLHWAEQRFRREELAGVLWATSSCFDLSVFEMFAPLSCGGSVIVAADALHLARHEAAAAVTLINTVPSAMAELLRLKAVGANVLAVNLAGEALGQKLVQQLYRETQVRRVQNLYGPTEYTTYTTGVELGRGSERAPTIGGAIANTEVYIVDAASRLVPLGVTGEILVGGCGLARGYWQRPELTAERFVPDGLSGAVGARLYRTGDLGRYLANGEIEYLGRQDHQVKLRGYRIELGEIESALLRYPGIREAAVIVRENQFGEKQIVSYIVAELDHPVGNDELRSYLRQSLPGYMVPELFVTLDAMPMTRNGKVDRRSLPAPDLTNQSATVKPRTPTEELVAGIWSEVLGLATVSCADNFFEIGGHSLKAVQVVSRVADRLQVELPVRAVFEAPTVQQLAKVVERDLNLDDDRMRLPIERVSRAGDLPLSFGQRRLWFIQRLEPSSAAYNLSFSVHFTGYLNLPALEQSINEVIRRHESLRTTFVETDTGPIQSIAPQLNLTLPIVDLSRLDKSQQELYAQQLVQTESCQPFDLERGPLVRLKLIRFSEQECMLAMSLHHIVCDGWSMSKLSAEMVALYNAFSQGRSSTLPELPIQYTDFTCWQRQYLQDDNLERDLSYWRTQLSDAPATLDLPVDNPRAAGRSHTAARMGRNLSVALHDELKEVSQKEGVTLYMLLLSCFYALLYRYSQQSDICIGTPIANRNRLECEPLIGFFVNTVVMRANPAGNLSFRSLLQQVRERSLAAYAHQDLPFERLVEELQPERSISDGPLFRVVFSFENTPPVDLQLEGLNATVNEAEAVTAKFDLMLTIRETDAGLRAVFEYDEDLFNAATIEEMSTHFDQLLVGVVADPNRQLADLLLTPQEQTQLLEWSETHSDYPRDKSVSALFEEQVERTPDAIAVTYEDQQLTYADLNQRANQLAHYLIAQGVKAESIVGILMERSLEVVIALLGTLKAGAAYLPLDPAYPRSRLEFMVSETAPVLLLTQERLQQRLPELSNNALCLDNEWFACASQSKANPNLAISPEQLAYVMYTSGSTGLPKGVSVRHRGIVRLVVDSSYVKLDEQEVLFQYAPLSFDAATFEIWGSLLNGCRLAMMKAGRASLHELGQEIRSRQVTTLWLTSSVFHLMVEEQLEDLRSVRQMIAGGDVLAAADVRRMLEKYSDSVVINGYGPTEGTTFTCCCKVTKAAEVGASIPIGKPIGATYVYVLDPQMRPVPVGATGELYIGGDGLARGYWQRAPLTAERFVPDPFGVGTRLYRTGDQVKWLRAGELEFLGRIDQQVKLRGHRIELGEIEVTLKQHAAVREVAVVAREDGGRGKLLVAYVVPKESAQTSAAELRKYLRERLPDYMVPSAFVLLDKLPLTLNGKLDRDALPELCSTREESLVAPRGEVDEILAQIWCEVLGLDEVSIYGNFFELGGHSLLATQLVSRIRRVFNIELPLSAIFELPVLASLSKRVETARRAALGVALPPLNIASREESLPLSFAQQRLWFLQRLEPASASYNISFSARLKGALSLAALADSINDIVRRHEVLRTTFSDGVQVIAPKLVLTPAIVDLSLLAAADREKQARRLIDEEGRRPFDLEVGPLLRLIVLRLSSEECVLTLSMHHTISDGWSCGIFIRELTANYEAMSGGLPSPLAELEIQYGDFAVWQRQWLKGDAINSQLTYWKTQLGGSLAVLELPYDRPRPPARSEQGAVVKFKLSPELVSRLKTLGRGEGATLFMTLLAGFQLLLSRYSGQTEVLVGTPVSNRGVADIKGLIGNFVNTVVMRTDLSGNPTFRELLARVRDVAIAAYTHQDVPFERLVSELHAERDLSRTPLFQVMLVLQNTPLADLKLKGIELQAEDTDNGTAKFDMTVQLAETGNGIEGKWEYSTDLFDASTIERMVTHFQALLEGVVDDEEQRVSAIRLLSEAEEEQLRKFNDTKADYGREEYLHQLFEAQVEKRPQAIALISEGQELSYEEVNRRANRLAHHLRGLGVGAETRVAILLERSPELIISLLAVLKAGGAYLPLDAAYPRERLRFMLEDTKAAVVLTQQSLVPSLPEQDGLLVNLDAAAETIARQSAENPRPWGQAGNLSHIIYTSGSTGRPKGVAIAHGSVVNFLHWAEQRFRREELAGVLWATSSCFDLSVFEIFAPLSCGGSVIVAADALHLARHEAAAAVTLINTVPSAMAELLRLKAVGANVLAVNLAGEALGQKLVQQLYRETQVRRVQNLYGPTEYTTYTTGVELGRGSERAPTIGGAIANTEVYIVDAASRLVPLGVRGEILVGGCGLARGYWQRPELTAERFVPDGLSGAVGARLYRTGDLGRYMANGEIEYLGRQDHQVKLRGYRIELGEIETVLNSHPEVETAAVVVREDESGHKYLAGYVVGAALTSTSELRRFLYTKLPHYMVPATLMRLEQLHLTPNGKIDRKTLPAPVREASTEVSVAPRTETEKILAEIWQQVLKVDQVSVSDNFFDLGGDSILSIHVVTQARRAGLILSPRQFFQQQTLANLALVAEESFSARASGNEHEAQAGHIQAAFEDTNLEDVYPLTPFQQGMLFHVLDAPDAGMYLTQQRYTLKGELDLSAFRNAFQAVMDRHQILRTAFNMAAPDGPVQMVYRHLNLPWAVHDWREISPAEEAAHLQVLLQADYECGFDLAHPPLMRITLIRTEPEVYEFIWSFHLLLLDGWSVQVIFNELLSFYRAFRTGQPVTLEPPIRYRDYIDWLQQQSQDQAESYWRQSLTGFTTPTSLGADRTAVAGVPSTQTYKEKSLVLDDAITTALRSFAGQHRLTLNTLIQGAWALLLGRRSGSDDVVFGSVVAGRAADFPGIDSAVGVFVNALPVRVRVPDAGPVAPWLEELQKQQGEARHFEYCSLVSIQGWSEVPRRQPLFESVLIFQNILNDVALPESEGVKVLAINSTERSNLPLALIVEPGARLVFKVVYQSNRFEDATIDRILENLQRTISEITTNPNTTLSSLSYHADAHRKLLIDSFNQSLASV